MTGENEPSNYKDSRLLPALTGRNVLAVLAMAASGIGGINVHEQVSAMLAKPDATKLFKPLQPVQNSMDTELVVASENTHGEIGDEDGKVLNNLKQAVDEERINALLLQETKTSDAQLLRQAFPSANVYRMRADLMQEKGSGGFGNTMVIFNEQVKELPSQSLPGKSPVDNMTSTLAAGAKDIAQGHTSLKSARDALDENRIIGGVVMKAYDGVKMRDVTVMTTHISGVKGMKGTQKRKESLELRTRQNDMAFEHIKKHTKKDEPAVVCGDFNNSPTNIIRRFSEIGYYVDRTGPTSVKKPETIDFCAYHGMGVLGLGQTAVLKKFKTDHYMIRVKFSLRPPEQ